MSQLINELNQLLKEIRYRGQASPAMIEEAIRISNLLKKQIEQ